MLLLGSFMGVLDPFVVTVALPPARPGNVVAVIAGSCEIRAVHVARRDLLRWQFDLIWSLLELHLDQLGPEDVRWEPAEHAWTVRPGGDGAWLPDWEVPEPDPVPVPTIAWVSWHIGWWWTVTIAHLQGRPVPDRTEITWPGTAAGSIRWLRDLRGEWLAVLDGLAETDLDAPAPFPWPETPEMTVAHTVAWVNAELMKNSAEIGQLRLLRAASKE